MYKRSRMSRGNPKDFQEPTHPLIYDARWLVVYKEKREEKPTLPTIPAPYAQCRPSPPKHIECLFYFVWRKMRYEGPSSRALIKTSVACDIILSSLEVS